MPDLTRTTDRTATAIKAPRRAPARTSRRRRLLLGTDPLGATTMDAPAPAVSGTWTSGGDLPLALCWMGRADNAVVLADGSVLVAGGEDSSQAAHTQAARYEPTTEAWSSTGPMRTARIRHSTTVLADGRVLVAGGATGAAGSLTVASAELYDPRTATWTPTGPLNHQRRHHTATLLPDGKVLVAGGWAIRSADSAQSLASTELYDPTVGTWSLVAPMTDARFLHSAVLLPDGRVLVTGGGIPVDHIYSVAMSHCELFDPASGRWTATASLPDIRADHDATVLADGTVLVTGGTRGDVDGLDPYSLAAVAIYDPVADAWTDGQDMAWGRSWHRVVVLSSGKVLVIGGGEAAASDVGYRNVAVYDPVATTWSPAAGLAVGRYGFAAVPLSDGRVLATGGTVINGNATAIPGRPTLTTSTEIFTP